MNRDEIEKLLDGTTPGPWRIGSWGDNVFGTGPKDEWLPICRVKRDDAPLDESMDGKDARLIAAIHSIADTALDALARLEDAEAAQALVVERAAEMDPVAAPDTAAICGALLSLPAVYAHQINTGVRDVYDPLQRFFRMEDVLRALIPKRTADDRA